MINFRPVGLAATPVSIAGAGSVLQLTYTVPVNLRAILTHCSIRIESTAAAINTVQGLINATAAGTGVEVFRVVWLAGGARLQTSFQPYIDLMTGDTVTFFSINTAAINVSLGLFAVVREYQP